MLRWATLGTVIALYLVAVTSFVYPATCRVPPLTTQWHDCSTERCSASQIISTDDNDDNSEPELQLPPGRRTSGFFSFLFDDTLRLLNPKTMGSYQTKRTKQFGDIFRTKIFFKPTVFVTSEETLTQLGQEEGRTKASMGTEAFFPPHHQTLFGPNSLLVQSGEAHDRLRRLIQPSLSANLMTTVYQPIIDKAMEDFLSDLASDNNGDEYVKMVPNLRSFFISIALRVLLGRSSEVPPGLAEDLTIWSKGLLSPPLTFIPWSTAAKALRARKRICATMAPLLEQARGLSVSSTDLVGQDDNGDDSATHNSLLGRLVSSVDKETGLQLSDEEILDNVLTLIFAGSDTTASAGTSLWMTLSLYPNLKDHLQKNPHRIDRFVEHVLEAYPPAPFSMRLTKEPLSVRNYDIPPGWLVVYGFAGALASKEQHSNGEEWWETMFAMEDNNEETSGNSSSASGSAAFGAGPRMCPGRYLAIMELGTLCQKLVGNYDWKLKKGQNLQQTYTPGFFPKDGLQIKFVKGIE